MSAEASKIVAHKVTGTVKSYDHKLGWGFITRSDNGQDVFVHNSGLVSYIRAAIQFIPENCSENLPKLLPKTLQELHSKRNKYVVNIRLNSWGHFYVGTELNFHLQPSPRGYDGRV